MTLKLVPNHQPRNISTLVLQRIRSLKIGQKMQDLPEALWHDSFHFYVKKDTNRQGGPNLRLIRLDPHQPSLTVTGYIYNKFVHPFENRFITPREAARLQGFPDDVVFKGSLTSVQRQIGDAVPIELGKALFHALMQTSKKIFPEQKEFPAISLFSGAGGLDVAAKSIVDADGSYWKTLTCLELEKDRCETLRSYFDQTVTIVQADARTISGKDLLAINHKNASDVWLLYGGPPCQSFSQAGKQQGLVDPRSELLFEFIRFVQEISPSLLLLENVPNLKAIAKGKLLQTLVKEIENLGYTVEYRVLNSAHYGNAQKRHRLILLGIKKSLGIVAHFPEPTHGERGNLFGLNPFKTVGEAFEGLPQINL